jgi:hypothetical protein
VVWRSLIIAGYAALAVLVGIAHGGRGLMTLGFFYFCAGAWVAFLVAWNWISRAAGRRHVQRLAGTR